MSSDASCDTPWPPAGCPALAWPPLPDDDARMAWYRAVISARAELWAGHRSAPTLAPVDAAAVAMRETTLGCALPPLLRRYHLELGALSLAERLCGVDTEPRIEPLIDAYPAIRERALDEDDCARLAELVVFSDYLGNGNLFCFHRLSGEVYYFDHDEGAMLTRFFPSVADYLDALMILSLGEVHEDTAQAEALLVQRHGQALVRKWMY